VISGVKFRQISFINWLTVMDRYDIIYDK
jgi:hypothetical protein